MRRESSVEEPTLGGAPAHPDSHLVILDLNGGVDKKQNKVGRAPRRERWHGVENCVVDEKCVSNRI